MDKLSGSFWRLANRKTAGRMTMMKVRFHIGPDNGESCCSLKDYCYEKDDTFLPVGLLPRLLLR